MRREGGIDQLREENALLRHRLDEVEATLRALSAGEVDAVFAAEREQVLTLEAPETHYRILVEQMPQATASLTADGTILHANRALADLLGRPAETLSGTAFEAFVAAASQPAFAEVLRDGCRQERSVELMLQATGSRSVHVHLAARPLQAGPFGECVLVTDVTTQREYETLRRSQEALQLADRRKDEFVAMLAHELRNPLAPIRNALELLKVQPVAPGFERWRDVIDRQVQIMTRLLEDILDVSRISLNKLELRRQRVALADVLESAMETSRPLIDGGRHRLDVILPPEPVYLLADPLRLAQVFANLLTNAAKYTEDGGDITVRAVREGNEVVVTVADTGIGINAEMLPRIFDMLSQAELAMPRSQGGLGIGLAMVRGIVELHGGSVAAHSAGSGKGSEFVVRLPLTA